MVLHRCKDFANIRSQVNGLLHYSETCEERQDKDSRSWCEHEWREILKLCATRCCSHGPGCLSVLSDGTTNLEEKKSCCYSNLRMNDLNIWGRKISRRSVYMQVTLRLKDCLMLIWVAGFLKFRKKNHCCKNKLWSWTSSSTWYGFWWDGVEESQMWQRFLKWG